MVKRTLSPSFALRRMGFALSIGVLSMGAMLVAGCASRPDPQDDPEGYADYVETNDPIEPFNRAVFKFNEAFDTLLLTPLAIIYRDIYPPIMQKGTHNILVNLRAPVVIFNDLFQGDTRGAGITAQRLLINTTLGLGGLRDTAAINFELPQLDEDFGQTLAVWGVGDGPYLVLPIIGPSNPRDAVGLGVDSAFLDPIGAAALWTDTDWIDTFARTRTGVTAVDARARALAATDELKRTSLDYYATIRSAFRQSRNNAINDGGRNEPERIEPGVQIRP